MISNEIQGVRHDKFHGRMYGASNNAPSYINASDYANKAGAHLVSKSEVARLDDILFTQLSHALDSDHIAETPEILGAVGQQTRDVVLH
jgi:hypothetical protein